MFSLLLFALHFSFSLIYAADGRTELATPIAINILDYVAFSSSKKGNRSVLFEFFPQNNPLVTEVATYVSVLSMTHPDKDPKANKKTLGKIARLLYKSVKKTLNLNRAVKIANENLYEDARNQNKEWNTYAKKHNAMGMLYLVSNPRSASLEPSKPCMTTLALDQGLGLNPGRKLLEGIIPGQYWFHARPHLNSNEINLLIRMPLRKGMAHTNIVEDVANYSRKAKGAKDEDVMVTILSLSSQIDKHHPPKPKPMIQKKPEESSCIIG